MRGSGRGELAGGTSPAAREGTVVVRFCWFVLCIPFFCIVVVTVPFVCCSVKLPLSRPTGFCLFLSIHGEVYTAPGLLATSGTQLSQRGKRILGHELAGLIERALN